MIIAAFLPCIITTYILKAKNCQFNSWYAFPIVRSREGDGKPFSAFNRVRLSREEVMQ